MTFLPALRRGVIAALAATVIALSACSNSDPAREPDPANPNTDSAEASLAHAMTTFRSAQLMTVTLVDNDSGKTTITRDLANDAIEVSRRLRGGTFLTLRRIGPDYYLRTNADSWDSEKFPGLSTQFSPSMGKGWYAMRPDADGFDVVLEVHDAGAEISGLLPKGALEATGSTKVIDGVKTSEFASPTWKVYISDEAQQLVEAINLEGTTRYLYDFDPQPLSKPKNVRHDLS